MKRILLDENVPIGLRQHLLADEVETIQHLNLKSTDEAVVVGVAQAYDVLITADKILPFQQNLILMSFQLIVLLSNRIKEILACLEKIEAAIALDVPMVIFKHDNEQ
jgi:hypothetical protein